MTAWPEKEHLRELLFKERRLLLGVSMVLLAHQLLGITVTNDAETLGLRFDIENPERVFYAVWIVWGWCLWRFVQLMYSLKARSEYPYEVRSTVHRRLVDRVALRLVKREAQALYRSEIPKDLRRGLVTLVTGRGRVTAGGINEAGWTNVTVTRRWAEDPESPRNRLEISSTRSKALTGDHVREWHIGGKSSSGHENRIHYSEETVQVPNTQIDAGKWPFFLASVWTFLATSFFTDFYFPAAIGVAPVMVEMYQKLAQQRPQAPEAISTPILTGQ